MQVETLFETSDGFGLEPEDVPMEKELAIRRSYIQKDDADVVRLWHQLEATWDEIRAARDLRG